MDAEFSDIEVGIFTGDYGSQRRKYPASLVPSFCDDSGTSGCMRQKMAGHWKWIPEVDCWCR